MDVATDAATAYLEEMEGKLVDHPLVRPGLPMDVKRRMVILFAQYQSVIRVQKAIKDEFGIDVDKRTVANYNPDGPTPRIGRRLREMFEAVRKDWICEITQVGISHQTHRLRRLERMIDKAEDAKEFDVAMKGLEQAAKEMGGVLTNTSKVRHEGQIVHRHLSVEDAREELALRLSAHIEGQMIDVTPNAPKLLDNKDKPQI